jgi:hypothetical protein
VNKIAASLVHFLLILIKMFKKRIKKIIYVMVTDGAEQDSQEAASFSLLESEPHQNVQSINFRILHYVNHNK